MSASDVTIYHNPRCSKSRSTLALLQARGIEPDVILYLEQALDVEGIRRLLSLLEIPASVLVRNSEAEYEVAALSADSSEEQLVNAMAAYPRLIERPVVVRGDRAVIGRPPENVLDLLD